LLNILASTSSILTFSYPGDVLAVRHLDDVLAAIYHVPKGEPLESDRQRILDLPATKQGVPAGDQTGFSFFMAGLQIKTGILRSVLAS
jgi:hypothetical protein